MKIKSLISNIGAATIAALSLVGCQDYDNGFTEQKLQFIQNFKEIYGEVDPTQDWNLAERAKVTVTVSKPSNIKIYAKESGRYRIVGDYKDVSGTETLGFDVVEGTKDIMVSDGLTAQYTTVGGSVTFSGTRRILVDNDDEKVTIGQTDDYLEIEKEVYSAWRKHIPEGKCNLGKVSEDFVYVSTGEFTIYPVYWNTSNHNELGVYYFDENNDPQYIAIYKIKAGRENDDWTVKVTKDEDGNEVRTLETNYGDETTKGTGELQFCEIKSQWNDGVESKYEEWSDAYNDEQHYPYYIEFNSNDELVKGPDKIKAKGITVKLDLGMIFGMYIKTEHGHTYHSNRMRNTDAGVTYTTDDDGNVTSKETDITQKAVHGATFIDDGRMYLGFEDWSGDTGSDFDMNDCVFMFGDDVPMILDLTAQKWIISAEDLGNTHDIDYNDVVIEVSHTSGQEEAYVTPLAAGGTLASFVYFTDDEGNDFAVGSDIKGSNHEYKTGEIHELFSHEYAKETSGDYTPINVWNSTPDIYSKRVYPIKVGKKWSLASHVVDAEGFDGSDASMGGFNIRVIEQGQAVPKNVDVVDEHVQKIQNATDPKDPNVPYVICTPKYWTREDKSLTGHYRWPRENMPMLPTEGWGDKAAYHSEGHTFQAWVADKNDAKDWYQYPTGDNEDLTTAPTKLGVNPEASLEESMGGGTGGEGEGGNGKKDPNFTFGEISELELMIDVTYHFPYGSYSHDGNGTVELISGNTEIVEITDDNGIKAISAGETTVTLHLQETDEYRDATIIIKVKVVRKDNATFLIGAQYAWDSNAKTSYDLTMIPNGVHTIILCSENTEGMNDGVTYSSSKPSVATVSDDGVITAVKEGNAIITVTSGETDIYASKTATVNVTVEEDKTEYPEAGEYVFCTKVNNWDATYSYLTKNGNNLSISSASTENSKWTIEYVDDYYFTLKCETGEYVYCADPEVWSVSFKPEKPGTDSHGLYKFEANDDGTYKIYNKYNDENGAYGKYLGSNNCFDRSLTDYNICNWLLEPANSTKRRIINMAKKKK